MKLIDLIKLLLENVEIHGNIETDIEEQYIRFKKNPIMNKYVMILTKKG